MLEIAGSFFNPAAATEVAQCHEYLNQAIEINATDIDTNTTNITTNASNIDTNTSAIQTLQGSTSSVISLLIRTKSIRTPPTLID